MLTLSGVPAENSAPLLTMSLQWDTIHINRHGSRAAPT